MHWLEGTSRGAVRILGTLDAAACVDLLTGRCPVLHGDRLLSAHDATVQRLAAARLLMDDRKG